MLDIKASFGKMLDTGACLKTLDIKANFAAYPTS